MFFIVIVTYFVQWLRLGLYNGFTDCVTPTPSSEDGNRSHFRKFRIPDGGQSPKNSLIRIVIHHRQNTWKSNNFVFCVGWWKQNERDLYLWQTEMTIKIHHLLHHYHALISRSVLVISAETIASPFLAFLPFSVCFATAASGFGFLAFLPEVVAATFGGSCYCIYISYSHLFSNIFTMVLTVHSLICNRYKELLFPPSRFLSFTPPITSSILIHV
jgi:hypothetical protein